MLFFKGDLVRGGNKKPLWRDIPVSERDVRPLSSANDRQQLSFGREGDYLRVSFPCKSK